MARARTYRPEHPLEKRVPTPNEIQQLCDQYGLGDLQAVEGELGGCFNENLKVRTDTGLYVVRVMARLATVAHTEYADHVIAVLRENGLPALRPLRHPSGRSYTYLDGRIVQINPFVSGNSFDRSPDESASTGRMLRRFHEVLADFEAGPTPPWSNYPSERTLTEGLTRLRQMAGTVPARDIDRAQELFDRVMSRWETAGKDLPTTVIHGDWHPWNLLYDDRAEVSWITDFDFVQRAERLHDVAYALRWLLPGGSDGDVADPFLEGYGPLEPGERAALPTAVARASVFFVCTASFTPDPDEELEKQLPLQEPFIDWALSPDGEDTIKEIARV